MKDYKWIHTRKYYFAILRLIKTYAYYNSGKLKVTREWVDEDNKVCYIEFNNKFIYMAREHKDVDNLLRAAINVCVGE